MRPFAFTKGYVQPVGKLQYRGGGRAGAHVPYESVGRECVTDGLPSGVSKRSTVIQAVERATRINPYEWVLSTTAGASGNECVRAAESRIGAIQ